MPQAVNDIVCVDLSLPSPPGCIAPTPSPPFPTDQPTAFAGAQAFALAAIIIPPPPPATQCYQVVAVLKNECILPY